MYFPRLGILSPSRTLVTTYYISGSANMLPDACRTRSVGYEQGLNVLTPILTIKVVKNLLPREHDKNRVSRYSEKITLDGIQKKSLGPAACQNK